MFASMHAVQTSHWHHHQHCLDEDDFEGLTADLPWWRAILAGPRFIINLHTGAWDLATLRNRIWIASESAGILLLIVVIMTLGSISLRWHVAAMLVGECLTGFFAVWTVHHGCGRGEPGRTQRTEWLNLLSCSMFFHAEHHLFPAVPTAHLAELARRLDATGSTVNRQQVITLRSQDENGPEPPSRRMASRMTSAGTLVRSFPSDTKEQLCTLNCINSD
jgi:fatty acid desaturase